MATPGGIATWAIGVASYPVVRYVFIFYKVLYGFGTPDEEALIDRPLIQWTYARKRRPIESDHFKETP